MRAKNTLNTFMMCIAALAVATITWALVGYSLAFDGDGKIIGGLGHAFLNDVGFEPRDGTTIPHLVFFAFQATFCIITTALVSGAVVERMRFGPFLIFAALWSVLVYAVLAHWAFGGGWLTAQGTLDFAGGVPVEMGSGFSALAAALVVGARKDYGRQALLPHNAVYVPARRRPAVVRLVRLQRRQRLLDRQRERARVHEHAADAGLHAADVVRPRPRPRPPGDGDRRRDGDHRRLRRDHARRAASSARLGDGARRRSSRSRATRSSSGGRARASTRRSTCSPRTASRASSGILFIGFFAQKSWNGVADGLFYGDAGQLGSQVVAAVAAPGYAFGMTYVLLRVIGAVMPLRGTDRDEAVGMDIVHHGEEAYATGEGAILHHAPRRARTEEQRPVAAAGLSRGSSRAVGRSGTVRCAVCRARPPPARRPISR